VEVVRGVRVYPREFCHAAIRDLLLRQPPKPALVSRSYRGLPG